LRQIVHESIEWPVGRHTLAVPRVAERSERELFTRMIEQLGDKATPI
jgi:hypothetical protein